LGSTGRERRAGGRRPVMKLVIKKGNIGCNNNFTSVEIEDQIAFGAKIIAIA
jgi:hypothetical protein